MPFAKPEDTIVTTFAKPEDTIVTFGSPDDEVVGEDGGGFLATLGDVARQAPAGAIAGVNQMLETGRRIVGGVGEMSAEERARAIPSPGFPNGDTRPIAGELTVTQPFGEPETTAGAITRGVSQIGSGLIVGGPLAGAAKVGPLVTGGARMLGVGPKTARAVGLLGTGEAAAIAGEQFAVDPNEPNLSALIQSYPNLANPITEFMATDPTNTEAENRAAMAVEGAAAGILTAPMIAALMKGLRFMRGPKPSEQATAAGATGEGGTAAIVEPTLERAGTTFEDVGLPQTAPTGELPTAIPRPTAEVPLPARRPGEVPVGAEARTDVPGVPTVERVMVNPEAVSRQGARPVAAPTDVQVPAYRVRNANNKQIWWRGPLDMVGYLRTFGGMADPQGDLKALDITNEARTGDLLTTRISNVNERGLGPIINPQGMSLEDAAMRAWDAGYFPEFTDGPPDIRTFLDALGETWNLQGGRRFTQQDQDFLNQMPGPRDIDEEAAALGVDISNMSPTEARQEVDRAIAESSGLAGPAGPEALPPLQGDVAGPVERQLSAQPGAAAEGDFAGNIRLENLKSVEDISGALETIAQGARVGDEMLGGIDVEGARRGVVSDEQLKALATDVGLTMEDLVKRPRGQAFNAEGVFAARRLLAESSENLVRLARQVQMGRATDEQKVELLQAVSRHQAIQEAVTGLTAEAGRALRQFRITAATERARAAGIKELLNTSSGRDVDDLADALVKIEDAGGNMGAALNAAGKPGWRDKLFEYWINGLLSGPATHAVNALSNSLVALWQVPESVLSAGMSQFRKGPGRRSMREPVARAFGLVQGMKEGAWLAGRSFFTGDLPPEELGRVGKAAVERIGQAEEKIFGGRLPEAGAGTKIEARRQRAIGGPVGVAVRTPGRALQASDQFFKAVNRRADLSAQAYSEAARRGLTGQDRAQFISDFMNNPPAKALQRANDFAEKQTFTNPLGQKGSAFQNLVNQVPGGRVIVPFIRTPGNIIKYAAERSPFGLLMKETRDDLAGRNGAEAADDARARLAVGSMMSGAAAAMALEGNITGGGPTDPGERALLRATGWQPYSVKIGDTYYAYNRLEPLGLLLGVAADMVETGKAMSDPEADKLAAMLVGSVSQNLLSKTWLRGISDLVEAVNDPDRYGERYIQRLAGSFVPNVVNQASQVQDPVLRDARSMMDSIQNRLPTKSELPARRDVAGEVIRREGGLGPDIASPIYQSAVRQGPNAAVARYLLDLGETIPPVPRKMGKVELSGQQFGELSAAMGRLTFRNLSRMIQDPMFRQANKGVQRATVRRVINESREAARQLFNARYPELEIRRRVEKQREFME